jgi:hypothetical protein
MKPLFQPKGSCTHKNIPSPTGRWRWVHWNTRTLFSLCVTNLSFLCLNQTEQSERVGERRRGCHQSWHLAGGNGGRPNASEVSGISPLHFVTFILLEQAHRGGDNTLWVSSCWKPCAHSVLFSIHSFLLSLTLVIFLILLVTSCKSQKLNSLALSFLSI